MDALIEILKLIVPAVVTISMLLIKLKHSEDKAEKRVNEVKDSITKEFKTAAEKLKLNSKEYIANFVYASRKEALVNKYLEAINIAYGCQHSWIGFFHNGVLMSNNDHLVKMTAAYEWPRNFKNKNGEHLSVCNIIVETPITTMGDYKDRLSSDLWYNRGESDLNDSLFIAEFKRWGLYENLNILLYNEGTPIAVLGMNWTVPNEKDLAHRLETRTSQDAIRKIRSSMDGLVHILLN